MTSFAAVYGHASTLALVQLALQEDLGDTGDLTCAQLVADGAELQGEVIAKATGVVCGLPLFDVVFAALGGAVQVEHCVQDGEQVQSGQVCLRLRGSAATILQGERTALNLSQQLSGVATVSHAYAECVAGTKAGVFDTRKTAPGLRLLQKHAVQAGGARNHRIGLYDQVLIKENHIALMTPGADGSSPAAAVRRCRAQLGNSAVIQVEIETLDDLIPVLDAHASIVLLDNMGPDLLRKAVAIRDQHQHHAELEASGGITMETLRAVAESGVDRISIGALTHSVTALDLSLRCSPI